MRDATPVDVQAPPFVVRIEVFEGPLDLLLTLIRRQSLPITEVSLAKVTDSFLRYLEGLEIVDAVVLADFCETAATLMVIKSRAILPRPPEDEPDEESAAHELVERLRAFKHYRQTAEQLGQRERGGMRAFARVAPADVPPPARGDLEPSALTAAFKEALAEAEREARAEAGSDSAVVVERQRVRLVDRFNTIREVLLARRRITFREIIIGGRPKGAEPREFVIVSFLALLELLRRFAVTVRQNDLFGEIEIHALDGLATVTPPGDEGSFMEDLT